MGLWEWEGWCGAGQPQWDPQTLGRVRVGGMALAGYLLMSNEHRSGFLKMYLINIQCVSIKWVCFKDAKMCERWWQWCVVTRNTHSQNISKLILNYLGEVNDSTNSSLAKSGPVNGEMQGDCGLPTYPGEVQLTAEMSLQPEATAQRHLRSSPPRPGAKHSFARLWARRSFRGGCD